MNAKRQALLGLALVLLPAMLVAQGIPLGSEFLVNTYTTGKQTNPDVASRGDGSFLVVWAHGAGNPGIFARRYDTVGVASGPEFQLNSGTAVPGQYSKVAADGTGGFVVVWDATDGSTRGQRFDPASSPVGTPLSLAGTSGRVGADAAGDFVAVSTTPLGDYLGASNELYGQRFDSSGAGVGSQFVVRGSYTVPDSTTYYVFDTYYPGASSIAISAAGDYIVVWDEHVAYKMEGGRPQTVPPTGILGQRYHRSGVKLGSVFGVTGDAQTAPSIALDKPGNFIVVWSNTGSILGQRFDPAGAPVGPQLAVNQSTIGYNTTPAVAVNASGDFLVVWSNDSEDGSSSGIVGALFDRHGRRLASDFPINTYTTGVQDRPAVAGDGRGFVVTWESAAEDLSGFGIFGRRQNLLADALSADTGPASGTVSDRNGVLEPGETVFVAPAWKNATDAPITVTGTTPAALPCALGTACVTPLNTSAAYGSIASGAAASCNGVTPDACYLVSASAPRPATHWDGGFAETLSGGGGRFWTMHVGDSFADVPRSQPFYKKIETLLHTGITAGCTATTYCPGATVERDAMAIFIARALAGDGQLIPSTPVSGPLYDCSSGGHSNFTDVAPTDPFCKHVHYLANLNVLIGCNATQYCPGQAVTRDTMAAFIARALVAPGGGASVPISYTDPTTSRSYSCAAGSPLVHFSDVSVSNAFCKHIHYLWARGIVSGCTPTTYCPTAPVARDAMAKFIANAFGLQLYGP
jgi:S-layer homology domain